MRRFIASPCFPFALVAAVAFGLVLAGVLMAELLRLAACPLCIIQRMLYLLLGSFALCGIASGGTRIGRIAVGLLMTATAGTGAFVAGYQTWIQRFARNVQCTGDSPWWEDLVNWAGQQAPLLFEPNGLCSDPAWKLFSLSIAEWSLVIFTLLCGYSLYLTLRRSTRN